MSFLKSFFSRRRWFSGFLPLLTGSRAWRGSSRNYRPGGSEQGFRIGHYNGVAIPLEAENPVAALKHHSDKRGREEECSTGVPPLMKVISDAGIGSKVETGAKDMAGHPQGEHTQNVAQGSMAAFF